MRQPLFENCAFSTRRWDKTAQNFPQLCGSHGVMTDLTLFNVGGQNLEPQHLQARQAISESIFLSLNMPSPEQNVVLKASKN